MLLGLFHPSEGTVRINNQNLDEFNLSSVYEQMFYLSQDAPIFEGTLRENIVLDCSATDSEIEKVLQKCQLGTFLQHLPDKLATKIRTQGINLSGGEKQRLAFARLFFSNAEVIFLDEATSALDHQTEQQLMAAVQELFSLKSRDSWE